MKQYLKEDFGTIDKQELHRIAIQYESIPVIKNDNCYWFHGIGLRFSNCLFTIDFDFGYDNHWCGIKPYFIHAYLKDNDYIEYSRYDTATIKKQCDELVNNHKMEKKYSSYYFIYFYRSMNLM